MNIADWEEKFRWDVRGYPTTQEINAAYNWGIVARIGPVRRLMDYTENGQIWKETQASIDKVVDAWERSRKGK